jgi:predicted ATPase
LTVVTGANGVGKSNLYGALRLLVTAASGDVVSALVREGGPPKVMWAGPANFSRAMERAEIPIQGGPRKGPARVRLGFSGDEFGYMIELRLPVPTETAFNLDPVIKHECIFHGNAWRSASTLVDRKGPLLLHGQAESGRLSLLICPYMTHYLITLETQTRCLKCSDYVKCFGDGAFMQTFVPMPMRPQEAQ